MKLIRFKNVHPHHVVKLSLSQYETIITVQYLIFIYKRPSCQFSTKLTLVINNIKMFMKSTFSVRISSVISVTYRKQIAMLLSMLV